MGCMDSWFSAKKASGKGERVQSSGIGYAACQKLLTYEIGLSLCQWTPTRGKAMLPTLPQKGAAFIPPKMPVPPSGPSKQHNSVPRLRFIPAKVVYGSKRLVPSGANPLHH
ncbi:hypothetical protein IEQ34_024951 [Dendrobium chrysotoxum]|uniref:Uncharacterized protein n=2 Tax=Dendrobium TaxID=37818 RepID=A0AAV7FR79_DENCH|nr:hypothetical protein IEQ34_024951 [Dendrobium chrysotoxum]